VHWVRKVSWSSHGIFAVNFSWFYDHQLILWTWVVAVPLLLQWQRVHNWSSDMEIGWRLLLCHKGKNTWDTNTSRSSIILSYFGAHSRRYGNLCLIPSPKI
jgi:hypothetical protein